MTLTEAKVQHAQRELTRLNEAIIELWRERDDLVEQILDSGQTIFTAENQADIRELEMAAQLLDARWTQCYDFINGAEFTMIDDGPAAYKMNGVF